MADPPLPLSSRGRGSGGFGCDEMTNFPLPLSSRGRESGGFGCDGVTAIEGVLGWRIGDLGFEI